MNTLNKFRIASHLMRRSYAMMAMLLISALCATNASAQVTTLLTTQSFSSSIPSGWTNNSGAWSWESIGDGGSNGSLQCDDWDYYSSPDPLTTSSVNASSYAAAADSVWVEFDFFWEDCCYVQDGADTWELLANSDIIQSGTENNLYTWNNTSDCSWNNYQSASTYWKHYHILVPVSDRTSSMTITFDVLSGYGCSNPLIDNVTITGKAVPPTELSLTPNPKKLNFGTAAPGVPVTLYATVNSVGAVGTNLIITGTNLVASSAYTVVSGPPVGTIVPQGTSVQYGIQFQPFTAGTLTGTFTVATNGVDSGTQTMILTGIGAVPTISYSATSMFRGVNTELTDTSGVQYLYVNSTGAGPLAIQSVSLIGLDGPKAYTITHLPAGSISPGGVDSIGVKFIPDLEGQPDAHLVINTNAANIPWDTVSLFGVGILPHLAIDSGKTYPLPLTVNFDSVKLGATACLQVQLWNPGSDTLAITKNYFESADFDFALTPLTGADTIILPGNYKNVQMCFSPLQQGTRVATLRIRTNIPHTLTNPQRDTSSFVVNVVGVGVPVLSGKLLVTGPAQTDSAISEPGSSACQIDTLWNIGDATIIVDSITISGKSFSYKVDQSALTLPPHSHSTFQVCADPADTGAITSLLTAYGTSSGTPEIGTLNLGVYGLDVGDEAEIGTPLSSFTCDSEGATVIVTNTGKVSDIYTASIGGTDATDFTITSQSISPTIPGGGTFTYAVSFTPSKIGSESAQISVKRSSDGNITGPFSISGTGGAATIGGQGTAATAAPSAAAEQFFDTVMNTGTCSWTPGIPTLADNTDFTYVSGATTPIPAGGTGLLTFMFNPSATTGQYSSNVTFSNSVGRATAVSNTVYGTVAESGVQSVASSKGYSLEQNYPNPFSSSSQLEMTLPVASLVHLSIINVQGKTVETVLNQHFDAGTFGVTMNADGLTSGTYYYQMTAGDVTLTRQMVILK